MKRDEMAVTPARCEAAFRLIAKAARAGAPAPARLDIAVAAMPEAVHSGRSGKWLGDKLVAALVARRRVTVEHDGSSRRSRRFHVPGVGVTGWTSSAPGREWTAADDARLAELFADGASDQDCAVALKRTQGAIGVRRCVLGLRRKASVGRPPAPPPDEVTEAAAPPRPLPVLAGANVADASPVDRALAALDGRVAQGADGLWRLDGRPVGPRELVAAANRCGYAIAYPIIAPHPGAFVRGAPR